MSQISTNYEYVDHPKHYSKGGIEAIDVIDAFELDFCLGSAVKYILRCGNKPGESEGRDLEKAIWYIKHYIEKYGIDTQ